MDINGHQQLNDHSLLMNWLSSSLTHPEISPPSAWSARTRLPPEDSAGRSWGVSPGASVGSFRQMRCSWETVRRTPFGELFGIIMSDLRHKYVDKTWVPHGFFPIFAVGDRAERRWKSVKKTRSESANGWPFTIPTNRWKRPTLVALVGKNQPASPYIHRLSASATKRSLCLPQT